MWRYQLQPQLLRLALIRVCCIRHCVVAMVLLRGEAASKTEATIE
jgi:hypothetical protein